MTPVTSSAISGECSAALLLVNSKMVVTSTGPLSVSIVHSPSNAGSIPSRAIEGILIKCSGVPGATGGVPVPGAATNDSLARSQT